MKKNYNQILSFVELRERNTQNVFYEKLKFVYIEMPKFNKKIQDVQNNFEKWLFVFKNMHKLEKFPLKTQEDIFLKLFQQCEIAQYNPEELMLYEQSLKEHNDWFAVLETAEKKGIEKGITQNTQKIIINSLKQGIDIEIISKITGVSLIEIQKIQKELDLN